MTFPAEKSITSPLPLLVPLMLTFGIVISSVPLGTLTLINKDVLD